MDDETVWMLGRRPGLAYHEPKVGERTTMCGQRFGVIINGVPERGVLLDRSEAQVLGRPCGMCYEPDRKVAPRVVPSGQRRGAP